MKNSTYGSFSHKLKVEIPYKQAILLLGIYLKKKRKTLIQKDTCGDVAGSPVVRSQCFHWGRQGSVHGQGTEVL